MNNTPEKPVLELFPAWQKARELNKVISSSKRKTGPHDYDYGPRGSLGAQSAYIMHDLSELYILIGNSRAVHTCRRILESLSRLKSAAYLEFDTGKLTKEQFEEILLPLRRLETELQAISKLIEEHKKETNGPEETQADDDDDDDMPAC